MLTRSLTSSPYLFQLFFLPTEFYLFIHHGKSNVFALMFFGVWRWRWETVLLISIDHCVGDREHVSAFHCWNSYAYVLCPFVLDHPTARHYFLLSFLLNLPNLKEYIVLHPVLNTFSALASFCWIYTLPYEAINFAEISMHAFEQFLLKWSERTFFTIETLLPRFCILPPPSQSKFGFMIKIVFALSYVCMQFNLVASHFSQSLIIRQIFWFVHLKYILAFNTIYHRLFLPIYFSW